MITIDSWWKLYNCVAHPSEEDKRLFLVLIFEKVEVRKDIPGGSEDYFWTLFLDRAERTLHELTVYIYSYSYIYSYVYIYVYMYIYIYIYVYSYIYIAIYTHMNA